MSNLKGKRIAILSASGFEESELFEPKKAFEKAGAEVSIISLSKDDIRAWKDGNWSKGLEVDLSLKNANPGDFDALVLPGGVINPDILRNEKEAVEFIKSFSNTAKPIAAICHAPWLLIEADLIMGKSITSYSSIKKDVVNAGGNWVDQSVVVDSGIITSRSPSDLKDFISAITSEVLNGLNARPRNQVVAETVNNK